MTPLASLLLALLPVTRAEEPAPSAAAEVSARWGEGVKIASEDMSLQIRGRVQVRASALVPGAAEEALEPSAAIRRMRLVFQARKPSADLQFYLQLGLAPQDMESDLLVPVRDAVVIWTPLRDLGVKAGQMKVPFNRERVVSSSALQFVDRSITNAALNLDRDVGVQLFSENFLGLGDRLGYQIGVYNGDGRNRFVGDTGLLYVARLDVRPLGAFDDVNSQSDLLPRKGKPRLDLGVSVARNADTVRERSTTGSVLPVPFTYDHGAVDLVVKASRLSLHGEVLARRATAATATAEVEGVEVSGVSNSAWGWSAMGGYLLPGGWEPVVRYAVVEPLPGRQTGVVGETEARGGLNWYVQGHDLKIQADAGWLGGEAHPDGDLDLRLQTQVYF